MKSIILSFILLFVAISCKKENKAETEIAKINTDIKVERFDKLFSKVTANNLSELKTAYPFMFSEKYKDSFWLAKKNDTLQVQLFNEVDKTFNSFDDTENEIEALFNHLKYYFPEFNPPRVITTTNDVDYRSKVIVTDTIVVIALDTYLGSDHEFYGGIQKYLKSNFKKEQLVVDIAEEYAKKYIYQPQRKTLLDEMIYYGKQLYFKDVMIPFKTDAERIGYTQAELDWAMANESYVWRYFVERELLFSTDSKLPGRFINDAPFSKFYLEDIDADSPGRLGQYVGWQIIRAYMEQNDVTFKEMLIKNTEDIFNNTKFKPRK
ncbi:gliding motility-associated lipoprotein GldB [Flaviramulus basaltis]|uniref:Gliding motility-associated lipoprotein GldB n=1 Tax=Flaviramulus basaltis TaxID=369401 RepID=A0A1K2IBU5_9FLAO|nr:gliding motility lipoprotein GldB [Flaviramulus basaltis]SFZ89187.1 gliding motility-associated lipoprotein GldB [Flaviramulus basaltis]